MHRDAALTTSTLRGFVSPKGLVQTRDGALLLTWDDEGVRAFDGEVPAELRWELHDAVRACVALDEGFALAIAGAAPRVEVRSVRGFVRTASYALAAAPVCLVAALRAPRLLCLDAGGRLLRIELDGAGELVRAASSALVAEPFAAAALALSEDGASALLSASARDAKAFPVLHVDVDALTVQRTLKGPRAPVASLALSPDGAYFVACAGASLLVWAAGGGAARTVYRSKNYLCFVSFLDASRLVFDDRLGVCACVDLALRSELWKHPHYGPTAVADGLVAQTHYDEVYVRDGRTGAVVAKARAPKFPVHLLLDAPRRTVRLATSAGALLRAWRFEGPELELSREHNGAPIDAFAASDPWLLLGTREGCVLRYDLRALGEPFVLAPPGGEGSPTGCEALCADARADAVWACVASKLYRRALSTGAVEAEGGLQREAVKALVWAPKAGVLVALTRARRRPYSALVLFDPHSLQERLELRLDVDVDAIERADDGTLRLLSDEGTFRFDPAKPQEPTLVPDGSPRGTTRTASPAGDLGVECVARVARAGRPALSGVRLWRLASDERAEEPVADLVACPPCVGAPVWRGDGASFFTLHEDRHLRAWSGATGALLAAHALTVSRPAGLTPLPDGERALVTGYDGACELWSLR